MTEGQQDFDLLSQFVRKGDQSAFSVLMRRHLDIVFATALRKVGDQGAAQEVAQNVFMALARKAWQFSPEDSVPAWLHRTTLLESKHWLRGELRRRRREQTTAQLGTTMKTPDEQPAFRALLHYWMKPCFHCAKRTAQHCCCAFTRGRRLYRRGRGCCPETCGGRT